MSNDFTNLSTNVTTFTELCTSTACYLCTVTLPKPISFTVCVLPWFVLPKCDSSYLTELKSVIPWPIGQRYRICCNLRYLLHCPLLHQFWFISKLTNHAADIHIQIIHIMNICGRSTDPCTSPFVTGLWPEKQLSITSLCLQSSNQFSIHPAGVPWIPYDLTSPSLPCSFFSTPCDCSCESAFYFKSQSYLH